MSKHPEAEGLPSYEALLQENIRLKSELQVLCGRCVEASTTGDNDALYISEETPPPLAAVGTLAADQVARYSRQLLVSDFGVQAQKTLLSSSALVIGAGGLGSTVLLYLAGAGIGRLGIVDFDVVATSNLHRQVIHGEDMDGVNKARSARAAVLRLNSSVDCRTYEARFSAENGVGLVSGYDVVVDASDNPWTRYLISDACVLAGKPLVSAAALGIEGQATVYHYQGGPCYRCIHPKPMAAEASRSCSDNGVLGPVPGVMGCLQALEAIKLLTKKGDVLTQRLLTYDAMGPGFRVFKLPGRSLSCAVCGEAPTIRSLEDSVREAEACGLGNSEGPACRRPAALPKGHEVTCQEYARLRSEATGMAGSGHVLLDVRDKMQFEICRLEGARNVPYKELVKTVDSLPADTPVYVMCRRGILSAAATNLLLEKGLSQVYNIRGGLTAWHHEVDTGFPLY